MFDPCCLLFVQVVCWLGGLLVIALCSPGRQLTISDPYVLISFWMGVYLVYPSLAWCLGQPIPFLQSFSTDRVALVFLLHVLFIVGICSGYLALQSRGPRLSSRPQAGDLPCGWPLFLLALLFPLGSALGRVVAGGTFLPQQTYGAEWAESSQQLALAQSRSGLGYVTVQVLSRTAFYGRLLQGIGGGLILSRAIVVRRGLVRATAALSGGTVVLLVLTNATRSDAVIPLVISLVFADFLVGPLSWKRLIPVFLVCLAVFEVWGVYRQLRDQPLGAAIAQLRETLRSPVTDGDRTSFSEFTCMLGKEAVSIDLFSEPEGGRYLAAQFLSVLPSQFLPEKLTWQPTHDVLSEALLGPAAFQGFGVAGTGIGGAYRFAGVPGVFLMAVLLGAIMGGVQRWVNHVPACAPSGRVLLRMAIGAGIYAECFLFVRSDLGEFLRFLFYYLAVPWLVLSLLLTPRSRWLAPFPRLREVL